VSRQHPPESLLPRAARHGGFQALKPMNSYPCVLAFALFAATAQAQTATPSPRATPAPTPAQRATKPTSLTYSPPKNAVAVPRKDIDAGSRGWKPSMPSIYVLAPDHTGLTTRAQPTLFWYQSGPSNTRIEVTIIEPKNPKPVLRVGADKADLAGIHRLRLERYNITLTPGVVYRWTVALVVDPSSRSQDIIASDTIQRFEPDGLLKTALGRAEGLDRASIYADRGIWYDLLETVANEVDAAPRDADIRRLRASLFDQAGLKKVAAFDRK
jgi:hypothetical protein